MNVPQIPQTSVIEFISATGQHKTLTSMAGTKTIRAIRADALESLSHFQCVVCEDVHSKPLRARCCDAILCAFCYNHLETPKACPNDREPFFNTLSRDLIPMGRPVYKQIEHLMRHFTDIEANGTDTTKSEAQQVALATLEGRPASGTAMHQPFGVVSSLQANRVSSRAVFRHLAPVQAPAIQPVDTRPLWNNSYTQMYRDHMRLLEHQEDFLRQSGRSLGGLLAAFRNFSHSHGLDPDNKYPLDMINGIQIFNDDGLIELNEQPPQRQPVVTVIAPAAAHELQDNGYLRISPRSNDNNNVVVELPQAFAQPLRIHSNGGDIITGPGYRIKHGGYISSSGNICIAVDSTRVKVKTTGPDAEVTVANHNEPIGHRTELCVRSSNGKIRITNW